MTVNSNQNVNFISGDKSDFNGFAYIELYVGNAHQAVHYYRTAYGFKPTAFLGMETGIRDRTSFLLEQNGIKLIITSPISKNSEIARHIHQHGDSVKDIALNVDNAYETYHNLMKKGASPVSEPQKVTSESGEIVTAQVKTFGETVHTLVEQKGEIFNHLPNFQKLDADALISPDLDEIDHVAICLEPETLDVWVDFYKRVFGFHQSHQEDVTTEYSAMNSKVVQDSSATIKFAMSEPAQGKRKSQIEEFLAYYGCAGVQHVAFSSTNIINSINVLKSSGIEFLVPPKTYYERLPERIGEIDISIEQLSANNVLVDRDEWGYLLQTFTKPAQSLPTMFFEIIQRRKARGFGAGNIKALFEAVELEQQKRGNL